MAYYQSKYSIGLNSEGYVIAERGGKRYYQKKRAPTFVNKFGGGDSSYRDASYWQFFVQTNWRNGAKQLKFDDAGKFWKSTDIDTTQLEQIKLSKSFVSAGQLASNVNVETIASWRSTAASLYGDASLQEYYRLEDLTGKNGNTLTNNNSATFVSGKFNNGVSGGSSDANKSLSVNSKLGYTNGAYGISFWVKLNTDIGLGLTYDFFEVVDDTSDTSLLISYENNAGTKRLLLQHVILGTSTDLITYNIDLGTANWHHIVLTTTGSGGTLQGYVDNVATSPATHTAGTGASAGTAGTHILEGRTANANSSLAIIDDLALLNRNLTAADVAIAYANSIDTDIPASTSSVAYAGTSGGKIYSWDNSTTWTEVFDTRRLTWFETGTDTGFFVGDDGGTEKACAQGFQVAVAQKMKGVSVYLKKNAGTPGNITVRIETNNAGVPSGTLVDAAATGTITAFTTTSDAWYTVEFATNFSLTATTVYWIVLKTAAAANDNNYKWEGKTASGYASGTNATSTDGGSTWSAGTSDAYFRVLGNTTSVNCSLVTKVGGTKKMLFGTGNPSGTDTGDARIYSYDGSTWALNKTFTGTSESVINSLVEYSADTKVYVGVGSKAEIYYSSDLSTYTLSKDIDVPDNPGYIYAMKEYNSYLYAGGGSPELIPTQYYNGFLNYYDQTTWRALYPFDFTVLKSCEFYDAYLFLGTYHGQLYVYDTSSLNPLFNFKDQYEYQQTIQCMKYFDDKLYIGLYPQTSSNDANVGVWVFERHGLYQAHSISGVTGYRCFAVVNGELLVGTGDNGYVYKLSTTTYSTQGWYQSSYYDANLPSIDKLYKEVTIKHDALASGQSVVVYYRYAETDSWTTLGTSDTDSATEKTLSFPTATYSKKISLKVELNTTTTTASPKVTEVVMRYTLYPERKWMWTMRLRAKKDLQLFDRTTESRTATEIRSDLETLMSTQSLYTFVDVDATSYTVLVNDIDQSSWVVNSDTVNEDEIILTLIEA
jgi:hypothetical protein